MATKEEVLQSHTVDELRAFADEHDVDLTGLTTKDDIVAVLNDAVTREHIDVAFPPEEEEEAAPEEGAPLPEGVIPTGGPTPSESQPPVGDVDVATLSKDRLKGETPPVLTIESWVRLGKHKDVPEEVVGHIAAVIGVEEDDKGKVFYTIKTRDEHDMLLVGLPVEAFDQVSTTGRPGVAAYG